MVPSPPAADPGPPPPELAGFERIERTLRLVSDGAVVLVQAPWMMALRPATRRLLAIDPDLAVAERLDEFHAAVRPGRTILWCLPPTDWALANLSRDVIRTERLRVVLWLAPDDLPGFRDAAPDLFDWARTVVSLPAEPPAALVDGLRAAVNAPGVVWWGPGLDAAFAAAFPGRRLWRLAVSDDYGSMIAKLNGVPSGECVAWTGVDDTAHVWRVRWAIARARRAWVIIERPPFAVQCPGWWPLGAMDRLGPVIDGLAATRAANPTLFAALCGGQPHWARSVSAYATDEFRRRWWEWSLDNFKALLVGPDERVRLALASTHRGLPWFPFVSIDSADDHRALRTLCHRIDARLRRRSPVESDDLGIRVSHLTPRSRATIARLSDMDEDSSASQVAWRFEGQLKGSEAPSHAWSMSAACAVDQVRESSALAMSPVVAWVLTHLLAGLERPRSVSHSGDMSMFFAIMASPFLAFLVEEDPIRLMAGATFQGDLDWSRESAIRVRRWLSSQVPVEIAARVAHGLAGRFAEVDAAEAPAMRQFAIELAVRVSAPPAKAIEWLSTHPSERSALARQLDIEVMDDTLPPEERALRRGIAALLRGDADTVALMARDPSVPIRAAAHLLALRDRFQSPPG